MKKNLIYHFIVIVSILSIANTEIYAKTDKKELEKKRIEAIQNKKYSIQIDRATPMSGKSIFLTSLYDIKISNDSAYLFLPYFGVAYSAPYGGGEGGVKAENKYKDYLLKMNKKGKYSISFNIYGKEDQYKVYMEIWLVNGNVEVSVQPVNKQSISYSGKMKF